MTNTCVNWQPGLTLEMIEEFAIKQAFGFFQGNKSATSRALDITVKTLDSKLEKYKNDEYERSIRSDEIRIRNENWVRRQRGLPELAAPSFPTATPAGSDENPETGICVQPTEEPAQEQHVPVPIRTEIQKVPSQSVAGSSAQKRSRPLQASASDAPKNQVRGRG